MSFKFYLFYLHQLVFARMQLNCVEKQFGDNFAILKVFLSHRLTSESEEMMQQVFNPSAE